MQWVETPEGWQRMKVRGGRNPGRAAMKALAAQMAELAEPRPFKLCPADQGAKRRAAARERRGRRGIKLLRQRHERRDFGVKELERRTTQMWRSI